MRAQVRVVHPHRTMEERLTSGRTVWVQDPALKEDKVFFKGTVKEDDGTAVQPASELHPTDFEQMWIDLPTTFQADVSV